MRNHDMSGFARAHLRTIGIFLIYLVLFSEAGKCIRGLYNVDESLFNSGFGLEGYMSVGGKLFCF